MSKIIHIRPVRRAEIDLSKLAHAVLLLARERAEAAAQTTPVKPPQHERSDAA